MLQKLPSSAPAPLPAAVAPLVAVENLSVGYAARRIGLWRRRAAPVPVVHNVSFTIQPGETLGLVGESGSGKTTVGRALLRRIPALGGTIRFRGEDITRLDGEALRQLRRHIQPVFQDPYGSLNPRLRVADIIAEPFIVHGIARSLDEAWPEVEKLIALVGLPADAAMRYPDAFSGGQRQRIGIARALAVKPDFIVADEPISALDVSIRAQIVNLFRDLQAELGVAYLFIAHDLAIVRSISHRVAILFAGRLVELAPRDALYDTPLHPYTQALLAAVPVPDPTQRRIRAAPGAATAALPTSGCRYATRCPRATAICRAEEPPLEEKRPAHFVACWNV